MQAINWFSGWPASQHRDSARRCALPAMFAALLAFATNISAETLKIGGNGSGMPAMQLLGAEFARRTPGAAVVVVPNLGSRGGLKALRDGALDVAITSRALTPDLILRPKNDGDTALQQAMSPEMRQAVDAALARPGMIIATTDQDASEMLEKTVGALGVTSMSLVLTEKRRLNLLSINGVAPNPNTLGNGSYRYGKTMYLVRNGAATEAVLRFNAFVASREGRQLLMNAGYRIAGGS